MSSKDTQNLETIKYIKNNGVTPQQFPSSGIKYIEAPDGTKIITEPTTDHGSIIDRHTGKLIAGKLRVTNTKAHGDISTELVTTE